MLYSRRFVAFGRQYLRLRLSGFCKILHFDKYGRLIQTQKRIYVAALCYNYSLFIIVKGEKNIYMDKMGLICDVLFFIRLDT